MATVDDPKAVLAFAARLVGQVKPVESDAVGSHWIYAQTSDGPKEIRTLAFAQAVIRSGRYRELFVSDQQTGTPGGNTALKLTVGEEP